ncbi:HEAT repeat domain-containing protein [Candidatus Micrarchaeota archaeon]|nr:HEAT repeat domain-containing protein [Candidatus Micrarchaeota archaeon]
MIRMKQVYFNKFAIPHLPTERKRVLDDGAKIPHGHRRSRRFTTIFSAEGSAFGEAMPSPSSIQDPRQRPQKVRFPTVFSDNADPVIDHADDFIHDLSSEKPIETLSLLECRHCLDSRNVNSRMYVGIIARLSSLLEHGRDIGPCETLLRNLLRHPDKIIRYDVAALLTSYYYENATEFALLGRLLRSKDPSVRKASKQALSDKLARLKKESDPDLLRIASAKYLPRIDRALFNASSSARYAATMILEAFAEFDITASSTLLAHQTPSIH